jgi:hypothetical protein
MGASIKLILSPTPPVECLSATGSPFPKLRVFPEAIYASVNASISVSESPCKKQAIKKALIW